MSKAIIMRGLSGSGKTTFARVIPNTVRISRDDIRRLLFDIEGKGVMDKAGEKAVTKFQRDWIERELDAGRDVVVDDTNLNRGILLSLCQFINDLGHDFEIVTLNVHSEAAKLQNLGRRPLDQVPDWVIDRQVKNAWWGTPKNEPYVYKRYEPLHFSKPAYTFDLDGTLSLNKGGRGVFEFDRSNEDTPHEGLAYLTQRLMENIDGVYVGILTAREDKYRAQCKDWLNAHGIPFDFLVMRRTGDMRNDAVVKSDLWDEHIEPLYNVLTHFDDRRKVTVALRKKGVSVAQMDFGDF